MAKQQKESGADALRTLKQDIKEKTYRRLYLFFGEEVYLLRYYRDLLRKKLLTIGTEEFNEHRFTSENFSMDAFEESLEALPMMAEHTLVLVDEVDPFRLNEEQRERMAACLEDIPEYCTIIFSFETVPFKPDKRMKRLWAALDGVGLQVEFMRQSQRDLTPWIARHFLSRGKHISTDLCVYLTELAGGTMTALLSEIEKVAAYAPDGEITRRDIDAVVEPVLDAAVFRMTDALGERDYEGALQRLRDLLRLQQDPILILGAVSAQLRRLSAAKILLDNGRGVDDLMRLTGLKDYPARKTMSAARRFSPDFYRRASELCLEADVGMKTSADEPERLLEMLLLQLAQRS